MPKTLNTARRTVSCRLPVSMVGPFAALVEKTGTRPSRLVAVALQRLIDAEAREAA